MLFKAFLLALFVLAQSEIFVEDGSGSGSGSGSVVFPESEIVLEDGSGSGSGFVVFPQSEIFLEDGSGSGDDASGDIASGDVLQDDLILGPDGSSIHRQFISLGSGNSVEGSFDPRDEVIEVVNIKGSNNKQIHRTQVVQPGIKSPSNLALDEVDGSGLASGKIIEDHLNQGPDGSQIRQTFINMGSGDSVEGSFDPRDTIIEIDDIRGSNGAEVHRKQVVQQGVPQGRFRREAQEASGEIAEGSELEAKKCTIAASCEVNEDCGDGTCIGFLPGRCNCAACVEFWPCQDDTQCGGLQGACNATKGRCGCVEAYASHGITPLNMFLEFCNIKACADNECFGLRCNKGFCSCPTKKQ